MTPPVAQKSVTQTTLDNCLVRTRREVRVVAVSRAEIKGKTQKTIDSYIVKRERINQTRRANGDGTKTRKRIWSSTLDRWLVPLPSERRFFGASCPSAGEKKAVKSRFSVNFSRKVGRKRKLYKRGKSVVF